MDNDIIGGLAKLIGLWYIAGFIVTMFTVLWIWLTGGFVDKVRELVLLAVVESFPFPFNLVVGWQINPFSLIVGLFFQAVIFIIFIILMQRE